MDELFLRARFGFGLACNPALAHCFSRICLPSPFLRIWSRSWLASLGASSGNADWTVTVATKADVENHFNTHGTGEITEIKLMNGFGFIEYKDAMDARDVVPGE